jgi:hypothetical protein
MGLDEAWVAWVDGRQELVEVSGLGIGVCPGILGHRSALGRRDLGFADSRHALRAQVADPLGQLVGPPLALGLLAPPHLAALGCHQGPCPVARSSSSKRPSTARREALWTFSRSAQPSGSNCGVRSYTTGASLRPLLSVVLSLSHRLQPHPRRFSKRQHLRPDRSGGARRKGRKLLLPVASGNLDPTRGAGEIANAGTLLFRNGRKKVPLRNVRARIKRDTLIAKVGGASSRSPSRTSARPREPASAPSTPPRP